MEGFGLPALEALRMGCPLILSDIQVFHELFGNLPSYFDPQNESALVEYLKNPPVRTKEFLARAMELVKRFSWRKMAEETLNVYENSIGL